MGIDVTGFELARRRARAAELNVPVEELDQAEEKEEVKRRGRPPKQTEEAEGLTAKVGE